MASLSVSRVHQHSCGVSRRLIDYVFRFFASSCEIGRPALLPVWRPVVAQHLGVLTLCWRGLEISLSARDAMMDDELCAVNSTDEAPDSIHGNRISCRRFLLTSATLRKLIEKCASTLSRLYIHELDNTICSTSAVLVSLTYSAI